MLDIGSNDATLLKAYARPDLRRVGIDPTGDKFRSYYGDGIELIPDFFSADAFRARYGDARARIVTSIAMCYDLEAPQDFFRDVAAILSDDGVWHFEQSYMPSMLRMNSYDTICHEHLEYYSLRPVKRLLEEAGLRLLDVQMNAVNGGSFAVTAVPARSPRGGQRAGDRVAARPGRDGWVSIRRDPSVSSRNGCTSTGPTCSDWCAPSTTMASESSATAPPPRGTCCSSSAASRSGRSRPLRRSTPTSSAATPRARAFRSFPRKRPGPWRADYFLVLPWHFKEGILRPRSGVPRLGRQDDLPSPRDRDRGGLMEPFPSS